MGRKLIGWRRRMILWICLVILFPHWTGNDVYAAEEDENILHTADILVDQVDVRMPEIRLCIGGSDGGNISSDQVAVYRNEEKLENVSLQPLSEAAEESCIYLLLDVSKSVSAQAFEAFRETLSEMYENRAEAERIVLVTFGDEIRVVLEGDETVEEAESRIEALERDSQNTKLFDGIRKVTELAGQRQTENFVRKTLIVVTDGMDEGFTGDTTDQEALKELTQQGIAVYGMVDRKGDREAVNRFGEFVRAGGGEMLLWEAADVRNVMDELLHKLRSVLVLTVQAGNNKVSYQTETLMVVFEPWNLRKEVSAYIGRWIPDQEPPEIIKVQQEDNSTLEVVFSEPTEGMEAVSNYQLKSEEGLTVPVSVEKLDAEAVRLVFGEEFYQGKYELSCINMTDISMEKNPLTRNYEVELSGREREDVPEQDEKDEKGFPVLIAGLVLFLLLAVGATIYFAVTKRKNSQIQGVDSETICTDGQSVRKHVILKKDDGVRIEFYPKNAGDGKQAVSYVLHGSAIIGRADICDIYFDDALMSRQHFALEYEQGSLFITDLEAVNGTYVNGVRIKGRRKLQQDDVVSAGSMDLMLRWKEESVISC